MLNKLPSQAFGRDQPPRQRPLPEGRTNVTRRVWLAFALLLVAAGGAGAWGWATHRVPAILWQGYAEADFVKVGPTQPGLLTAVNARRGDAVAAGDLLFTQD